MGEYEKEQVLMKRSKNRHNFSGLLFFMALFFFTRSTRLWGVVHSSRSFVQDFVDAGRRLGGIYSD